MVANNLQLNDNKNNKKLASILPRGQAQGSSQLNEMISALHTLADGVVQRHLWAVLCPPL